MKIKWYLVIVFVLLLSIGTVGQEDVLRPRKKMIELGWDSPSTEYLKDHWEEMEERSPFDGVIFHLSPKGKISSLGLMDAQPWQKEDYAVCINDLKNCKFKQFTDNFVNIFFSPGTVQWNDNEAWKRIAEKAGICAWVSKESGCKGISLDFESYGKPLFLYNSENGLTWEETCRLVFQRGNEFIQSIAAQHPKAVILCLWMNSINVHSGRRTDPEKILRGTSYGLLPSFINGMLSAAPPDMILIDGCENGYYYDSREEYQQAALDMVLWTGPAMNLVQTDLKQKYRNQVRAGFGFYLDMFSNPEGSTFYRGPRKDGTRMDRLRENVQAAWDSSDQYVWIYGESNRWWNLPAEKNSKVRYWNDALPGLYNLLLEIKNPQIAATKIYEKIKKDKTVLNLLKNTDFSKGKQGGLPENWGTWQVENHPAGILVWDADTKTAQGTNVFNGCFIQETPVQEGQRYYFRCQVKTNRAESAMVRLRWQTPEGKWTMEANDVLLSIQTQEGQPIENGIIEGLARVPKGVGKMVVLLSMNGQNKNDFTQFDNVELYLVPKE